MDGPGQPEVDQRTRAMSREEGMARLQAQTRRHFLRSVTAGVGAMYLGSLASLSIARLKRQN